MVKITRNFDQNLNCSLCCTKFTIKIIFFAGSFRKYSVEAEPDGQFREKLKNFQKISSQNDLKELKPAKGSIKPPPPLSYSKLIDVSITRQVPLMIPLARPAVPLVAIDHCSRLKVVLFCQILWTYKCENSYHYRTWLWVGLVDK